MISIYLPPDGYISHKNLQNQNLYFTITKFRTKVYLTKKRSYLPKNIAIFLIKALVSENYYFTITKHKDYGYEDISFNTDDVYPYNYHYSVEYVIEECMRVINA